MRRPEIEAGGYPWHSTEHRPGKAGKGGRKERQGGEEGRRGRKGRQGGEARGRGREARQGHLSLLASLLPLGCPGCFDFSQTHPTSHFLDSEVKAPLRDAGHPELRIYIKKYKDGISLSLDTSVIFVLSFHYSKHTIY